LIVDELSLKSFFSIIKIIHKVNYRLKLVLNKERVY
jgi:hypothetical protein